MAITRPDLLNLALAAQARGELDTAARLCRKVLARTPGEFEALHLLGVLRAQQGRFGEAEGLLSQALKLDARHAPAQSNLGNVLSQLGRIEDSLHCFHRALAIDPASAETHYNLGNALLKAERFPESAAAYAEALKLRPDYPDAMLNLAETLRRQNRPGEALPWIVRALERNSEDAQAQNVLGSTLCELGKMEQAESAFERATAIDPTMTQAYLNQVGLRKIAAAEPLLGRMEALARDGRGLSIDRRSYLLFALAKAHEDAGRTEQAFAELLEANRLRRSLLRFDEAAARRRFDRVREVFTATLIAGAARHGASSDLPIFILGFPRSGTTLVEQILASHRDVRGAGELALLGQIAGGVSVRGIGFPECVPSLPPSAMAILGEEYLKRLRPLDPDARHITDKLPANYMFIGFIRMILPRARIIHVRRDPLDTCLSCFAHSFAAELGYAYELGELGRYYRCYLDLMAHWRAVLPADAMLEVQYERVVSDLDGQIRRMLDYCGLPWDPNCPSFHRSNRPVRTASVVQVRQPLYESSLQRWRRYERHLGPLIQALAGDSATQAPRV